MPDTRTTILDTAERLFAERGIQGVSVRAILAEAGVNMALAHYHFGDRDGLIREVLRRRVVPLNARRLERLAAAERAAFPASPALEDLLRAFCGPVVDLMEANPRFARLLGHLHVTADPALHEFFLEVFAEVLARFGSAFERVLAPRLPPERRLCRAHFTFGALVLTLTNYDDLESLDAAGPEVPRGADLLEEMVAFCAAGLLAPASGSAGAGTADPALQGP